MQLAPRSFNMAGLARRALSNQDARMYRCIARLWLLSASTLVASLGLAASQPEPGAGSNSAAKLFGFTAQDAAAQQSLERRFDSGIHAEDLDAWMKRLSSEANNVGSPHDKANAEFVRDQLREWGWDAQIEMF